MRILILDGAKDESVLPLDPWLCSLERGLLEHGHEVEWLRLRKLELGHCRGCFTCWSRTPGECALKDDATLIRRSYLRADLALFASPVVMGFVTSRLKRAIDRLLPMLSPYIDDVEGECHPRRRYPTYPDLALVLAPLVDTEDADLAIIRRIFERAALNFRGRFRFATTLEQDVSEVVDAIDHL